MYWNHPYVFLGLLVLPILFVLLIRFMRRRSQVIKASFSEKMRRSLWKEPSPSLFAIKYVSLFLSVILAVCALAGPHFGRAPYIRKNYGREIFILLDTSDSMLAEDVLPNRLAHAKLGIEDLLDVAVGDRVGLISS